MLFEVARKLKIFLTFRQLFHRFRWIRIGDIGNSDAAVQILTHGWITRLTVDGFSTSNQLKKREKKKKKKMNSLITMWMILHGVGFYAYSACDVENPSKKGEGSLYTNLKYIKIYQKQPKLLI